MKYAQASTLNFFELLFCPFVVTDNIYSSTKLAYKIVLNMVASHSFMKNGHEGTATSPKTSVCFYSASSCYMIVLQCTVCL